MNIRSIVVGLAALAMAAFAVPTASGATKVPEIKSMTRPLAGYSEIVFHGPTGPFRIEKRDSLEAGAPWVDMPEALITELAPGVYLGHFVNGKDDLAFYRVVSEADGISDLKGWTVRLTVSAPANGSFFVAGENPTVSVRILDTMAQGVTRADFSALSLYMYGPEEPWLTKTASKMLNATTDRTKTPHHYVDMLKNADVKVNGTTLTYALKPVSDEAPGTYTLALSARYAADTLQQIMKFATVQIGTATAEKSAITDPVTGVTTCAKCHQGAASGKMYMHHIDPGTTGTGNWAMDLEPGKSCKACHNNDGYAAFNDSSVAGGKVPDAIMRRAHGVHMGEELKLPFNTNSTNGVFREYTHVLFPADIKDCTQCHVDNRWKTAISQVACSSCHDTVWFGAVASLPASMKAHTGGPQTNDGRCATCHAPDPVAGEEASSVAGAHAITPPAIDPIDISMTPPANGQYYVAGESPLVTVVIRDDKGNPIDHTKVTDVNISTASLFVYGPRAKAVPVLTSAAKNVASKLRASVSSSIAGPWAINGKIFKIAVNGSAPQEIIITGVSNLVTAAEVVASLNSVITNLNGGAKATVSGANVNIKSTIQGAQARFEIYNGDVTSAMGWKRSPNTVMDPDVTIAAPSTPSNDLRALSDPLDYSDPKVTRNVANITYQLDDVAGLPAGTYNIYIYQIPKAGKIANLAAPTGIGHYTFQIGTKTPEKKVATNCADCHSDTTFHYFSGPIHAEPFDTDYCNACHDYGHTAPGEMFKNQGGTSLNGWSGFGAMPISRRVHGAHFGNYLNNPEEIYANATVDTFGHIIFPQDVRNCTTCHAESDSWKQNPGRVACLGCHDSPEAKAHGKLMTFMPNPTDPYGPSAQESCEVCHGADAAFSPDKVHKLKDPYVPPYRRLPRGE